MIAFDDDGFGHEELCCAILCGALLVPSAAIAQEVLIATAENGISVYYDPLDTTPQSGEVVRAWFRVDLSHSPNPRAPTSREEDAFNCPNGTMQRLSQRSYGSDGHLIEEFSVPYDARSMSVIPNGSMGESMWQAACLPVLIGTERDAVAVEECDGAATIPAHCDLHATGHSFGIRSWPPTD